MAGGLYLDIYDRLLTHYGPQYWWPAESPFEVLVGAVLTQNTNWTNVVKAIANLRTEGLLSFGALQAASPEVVAQCIRPSGYYNVKARRLINLLEMITGEYGSSLEALLADTTESARGKLLAVKGIGPETADAILLYGGGHPIFVVDAYTHRVFSRHGLAPEECDYHTLQELFVDNLPMESKLYNEYHALIVRVGKDFCKKGNPLCEQCPLKGVEG